MRQLIAGTISHMFTTSWNLTRKDDNKDHFGVFKADY